MSGIGNSATDNISNTGTNRIDGVLSGYAWTGSINFSFPTSSFQYGSSFNYGPDGEPGSFHTASNDIKGAARFILDKSFGNTANNGFSVEGFTNVNISETNSADANIRLAETDVAFPAWAYYPGTGYEAAGDVWFETNQFDNVEAGNYEWLTTIHEIGHALGLKHGHEKDEGGNNKKLPSKYDAMEYSVMTYRAYVGDDLSAGAFGNETFGFAQSFMMSDIAALQHMYGADFSTNSGDTVYKWKPGTGNTIVNGSVAINPGANRIFATIWDGGGEDTYDLSAYKNNLNIDLRAGEVSKFSNKQTANLGDGNDASGNIYNAMLFEGNTSSLIENAIGGSGNDKIEGNSANNTLSGHGGKDVLRGNKGNDTLNGNSGKDKLYGGEGNDTLNGNAGQDKLVGGEGDDDLDGGKYADILLGGEGNDNLFGGRADDKLRGNEGADSLYGGKGNDDIAGGKGADLLYGANGDDLIVGATGDDIISGGLGEDEMWGGEGSDEFVFDNTLDFSEASSVDEIMDFEIGLDKIRISNGGFDIGDIGIDIVITEIDAQNYDVTVSGTHVIHVTIEGAGGLTATDFLF